MRDGRCPRRRNDDRRSSSNGSLVDRNRVVRRIASETRDLVFHRVDQTQGGPRVIDVAVSQDARDDRARFIDTEMELLPATLAASSVLRGGPVTFADDRESCAVNDEVNGPLLPALRSLMSRCWLRRERVVWSGASRSTPINDSTDRRKPSAWRRGNLKTSRSVRAVSIAKSEYFL